MPHTPGNADRNFSAGPIDGPDQEDLRDLLQRSEVADMFDRAIQRRIGEMIGRAIFNPAKQEW